jgi:hypothetical protein
VKNPRWEHVDQKVAEKRKESTLVGDKVALKVDVTNVPDGTSVTFKVFDTSMSPPKQIGMASGKVAGGVGTAEWSIKRQTKLEFEGKVRSLISERAVLPVAKIFKLSF